MDVENGNQLDAQTDEGLGYQFEFKGSGGEYFRIWIVNLLLTIITLGIYSAWAKVRTNRYFYGNTLVAGSAFDYTADPKKILIGRLIAVAMLLIYQACVWFFPTEAIYVLIVFVLLMPLIFMSSIAFRMRYSSWRGISFNFTRDFSGAYKLFLPLMIYIIFLTAAPLLFGLSPEDLAPSEDATAEVDPSIIVYFISVGVASIAGMVLFPLWQRFYYNFVGSRVGFGKSKFQLELTPGKLYGLYLGAFGLIFAGIAAATVAAGFLFAPSETDVGFTSLIPFLMIIYIVMLGIYVLAFALIQTKLTNIVYSGIKLEGIEFKSTLGFGRMLVLYVTNTLAIIITLGLAIPWAKVRLAHYRAENMFLLSTNVDDITAQSAEEIDASADAMSDIFDLDIGL